MELPTLHLWGLLWHFDVMIKFTSFPRNIVLLWLWHLGADGLAASQGQLLNPPFLRSVSPCEDSVGCSVYTGYFKKFIEKWYENILLPLTANYETVPQCGSVDQYSVIIYVPQVPLY